jgi:hypothetical protein
VGRKGEPFLGGARTSRVHNPTQLLMRPGKCGYPPDDASVFLFAAVILMMRSQQRPKKKDLRLLVLSFI